MAIKTYKHGDKTKLSAHFAANEFQCKCGKAHDFQIEDGLIVKLEQLFAELNCSKIIVTSGYNVYPSQIENILDAHEAVHMSCVIGVRDPYKMQKVKAYIVLKPGFEPSDATRQMLMDYCRKHIAKYAMPKEIEFREELPKTLVGKVAYRVLEEEEEAKRKAAEAEAAKDE